MSVGPKNSPVQGDSMTESLKGRQVLVTGADGFIGSHLAERLVAEGAKVRALCIYNSLGTSGWIDTVPEATRAEMEIVLGDIRDVELVRQLLDGVECVFHLAALIAIPYSYQAPRSFVETNVLGTLNVLEAARTHHTPMVINTSTSEVYGTPQTTPITEDHRLFAQSPYAATKVAADQLTQSFALSFGLRALNLRPFNTYGPRQSLRAVIPTVLAQMLAGAETIRLGSLHPQRDFTYVSDTVDGYVKAATTSWDPGDTIHLGTGRTVSVGDLVEVCAEVTGTSPRVVVDEERVRPSGSEVQVLLSDPSRADQQLGWTPQVDLREGLARTAEWIRSHGMPRHADRYHR